MPQVIDHEPEYSRQHTKRKSIERALTILILFALSLFFALSVRGADNQPSQLWLAGSIWHKHELKVNGFVEKGLMGEFSKYDSSIYIHWPPGPAFFGLPLYIAGQAFSEESANSTEALVCGRPAKSLGFLFAICASVATVFLFFACRLLSGSSIVSGFTAFAFAVGYKTWPYASIYNRHIPSAMLVIVSIWAGLRACKNNRDRGALCLLALCTGLLPLFDYSSIILAPPLLLFGWKGIADSAREKPKQGVLFAVLFVTGPAVLGAYNWICFGKPWITSYSMSMQHEWARTFSGTFSGEPLKGFLFLLFNKGSIPESIIMGTGFPDNFLEYYRRQTFNGLLRYAPVLWLGVAGYLIELFRKDRRLPAALLLLAFFPTVILMGAHRTLFGGSNFDTRYIYHVTPILFLGIAYTAGFLIEKLEAKKLNLEILLALCIVLLCIGSFQQNIRQMVVTTVQTIKICPGLIESRTVLNAAFPNHGQAVFTLLFLGIFWFICLAIWEIVSRRKKSDL